MAVPGCVVRQVDSERKAGEVMGTKYERAPVDVQGMMQAVLKEHHEELQEHEVTVTCMLADGGQTKAGAAKAALMLNGLQCAATIKITDMKNRIMGVSDAVISIDKHVWIESLTDLSRKALLDRELEHLLVSRDKDEVVKLDCAGRPVLKMRRHDWQIGVFDSIIDRHGEDALDTKNVYEFLNGPGGQAVFEFMKTGVKVQALGEARPAPQAVIDHQEGVELVELALDLIKETHRCSTGMLQRRLHIGYTRASRVVDQLEERGIVGPPNGKGPREILIELPEVPEAAAA